MKKNKTTSNVNVEIKNDRDELLSELANELNKNNKEGGKVAYFLNEQDDPSTIIDWISTGSSLLDLAISNRPHGGLPCSRIVEIQGLEASGKSLMAAHLCSETQKKGGKAIVIDTENSAAPEFWSSLGVDLSKLLYIQRETVEEIFEMIEQSIGYIRKNNKDVLLTIIVDSVAGASTKTEIEADYGKDGYATTKAIIVSKAMRKITNMIGRQRVLLVFTNQLRMNLNAMAFGDRYVTAGGKAIAFHSSVRIRLNNIAKLKKNDVVIGNTIKGKVIKNRMGPPYREAEFDVYFDSGIADYVSWIEVLKKYEIISGNAAKWKYTTTAGENVEFATRDFVKLMNDKPELKEEIYLKICDKVIMHYKQPNSTIEEDAIIDDGMDKSKAEAED